MKTVLWNMRALAITLFLYVLAPTTIFAMFQEAGLVTTDDFPYIVLVAFALGVLFHWGKKYTLEQSFDLSFWKYLSKNFIGTVTMIVVGMGTLTAMWAAPGHGGLAPVTFATWLTVFWIGVGTDTINSGLTKSTP